MKPQKKRKKKPETLQQHALRLLNEVRKCRCEPCSNCQLILFDELEELLKIAKIEMPDSKGK